DDDFISAIAPELLKCFRRASSARFRSSRSVFVPYHFARFSRIGRAEDYRERETSEIRRRSGGSGPPLRTALQNSKLPGMFREFVAGRLNESQPAIPSPKPAPQIAPYSPASAD